MELKINLKDLKKSKDFDDYYKTEIIINHQKIKIDLEIQEFPLQKSIILVNNRLDNFNHYHSKAERELPKGENWILECIIFYFEENIEDIQFYYRN